MAVTKGVTAETLRQVSRLVPQASIGQLYVLFSSPVAASSLLSAGSTSSHSMKGSREGFRFSSFVTKNESKLKSVPSGIKKDNSDFFLHLHLNQYLLSWVCTFFSREDVN